MKNLSTIINAVTLAAVLVLYILFFKGSGKETEVGDHTVKDSLPEVAGGIVYINIDTVLNSYEMYFDIQADLQDKLKTSEAQLAGKEKSLRKEMEDFQYKIDRQLVTRSEAAEIQQQLMQKEQALYQLQNNLQLQLAEEEQVAQRKVLNSIMEYLKSLESTESYQFVLGTTFGGNILYAHEDLNITKMVINGLNEKYRRDKENE
ncbi:MAG: OmpH family outer membrane protein [Bacteroidales bacterium]|nr:OmpH family outer membrane protein [Bacteroidales bacterium]